MRHTRLGRTGLRVSRLCLGTMTFGLQPDAARTSSSPPSASGRCPRGRGIGGAHASTCSTPLTLPCGGSGPT